MKIKGRYNNSIISTLKPLNHDNRSENDTKTSSVSFIRVKCGVVRAEDVFRGNEDKIWRRDGWVMRDDRTLRLGKQENIYQREWRPRIFFFVYGKEKKTRHEGYVGAPINDTPWSYRHIERCAVYNLRNRWYGSEMTIRDRATSFFSSHRLVLVIHRVPEILKRVRERKSYSREKREKDARKTKVILSSCVVRGWAKAWRTKSRCTLLVHILDC